MQAYASTLEIRATTRVFRGPADRQAPIFRQEREGGIRRRMRKQPGGESGRHSCMGMGPSVRAFGTYGARLGGSRHTCGNGGCCKRGAPAQGLRGQSAQTSRHKCDSRSLRAVHRGICQAASGALLHGENRNSPDTGPDGLLFLGVGAPWFQPIFCFGGIYFQVKLTRARI